MASTGIEAPYTIASISRPLDSTHGRVQVAPVSGIKNGRKRKRHEVVVGVDGEGINIYNVQSQNQLTSYAIPPHSYLCCPPCSVYSRSTSTGQAQRVTFAALKDARDSSKRRLVSFTENAKGKTEHAADLNGPVKRECRLHDGELLGLQSVPSSLEEGHHLVACYKNGGVEFVKNDLSKTYWEDCRPSNSDESYTVEYATILDVESAKRGVLKDREDIIALIDQNDRKSRASAILFRVTRSHETKRRVELDAVRDPFESPLQSPRSACQNLAEYELPSRTTSFMNPAQYELHAQSGVLYQLLDGKLSIFDLAGTVPRFTTEFGSKSAPIESFARVPSSAVLTVSGGVATLFETSFGSIQASVSTKSLSKSPTKGTKRKRDDVEAAVSCDLISTFTELGLVVGLAGTELIGLQLGGDFRESRASKTKITRLSEVINKGSSKTTHKVDRSEKKAEKWNAWTAQVDALIASDDIEELEKLIANDPKLGRQRKEKKSQRGSNDPNGISNGDATVIEDMWPLPEAFEPQDLDKRKVLWILSKVFGSVEGIQNDLEVRVPSFKILEWLALTGFLNAPHVTQAFRTFAIMDGLAERQVTSGDLISAIQAIDDDFQLLHDLFSLPVHRDAPEVVQALRVVVQSFDSAAPQDARLALPAPPLANGDTEMVNGESEKPDEDVDDELDLETKAAENELDHVMSALNNGLEVRSELLRVILLRLHAFPSGNVRDTMRSLMSQSEIIFLIHILRIELADGGWTSKYVYAGDEGDEQGAFVNTLGDEAAKSSPNDQAIVAIVDLLNCAVDAIGASGWLVGYSSSASELIESLRAEISAGLEGCYEANTLGMLFAEVERCAASAGKSQLQSGSSGSHDAEEADVEASLFPLDSRFEAASVLRRNDKGAQKSKRAIGQEKSRQVGKYSFERIRI